MMAVLLLAWLPGGYAGVAPLDPKVVVQEDVYSYQPANNGAGPMWCHGSTCLVRTKEGVFATGLETLADAKPLNNCKWLLFTRGQDGWKRLPINDAGRTREPSPLATFSDGRVFVSVNPTLLTNRETYSGPAQPKILEFAPATSPTNFKRLLPRWEGMPAFTEHSYRSLASDPEARQLIVFQNIDYTHAEWSFLNRDGSWAAQGKIKWPVENGKPIRVCYPNVALKDRAVYFWGVSDIVEPNQSWREHKKQLTGQEWDYTFRRLFYTWTPDVTHQEFRAWQELANLDSTAGSITLGDLWVAQDGRVHLLWTEHAVDERLRAKFFPDAAPRHTLKYGVIKDGKILLQRALLQGGQKGETPGRARFQPGADDRLFVVFYVSGQDSQGHGISENRVLELSGAGEAGPSVRLPLTQPMPDFFTATPRAGSSPANEVDMLGPRAGSGSTISYARVQLVP